MCKTYLKFCLAILLASCDNSISREPTEPERTVEKFFEVYQEAGPRKALKQLLLTNKYISEQDSDSIGIKLEKLTNGFDDYQGYEIVDKKSYGEGIVLIICIAKYSQVPIRFKFRFYQPGNGWRIQDLTYQTNFLNEVE